MSAYTLFLDDKWDLALDENGRIATSSGAYAIAQNVACAIRLFTRDAYYDQTAGIPHFIVSLGRLPSEAVMRSRYKKAAQSVEGVAEATVEITSYDGRVCSGVIKIKLGKGGSADVTF